MNTKTILMISVVLNAGLLCSVAFLTRQIPNQNYLPGAPPCSPDRMIVRPAQSGETPRFGPEFQASLMCCDKSQRPILLDLETGKRLVEPTFETFGNDAKACVTWLQSNGLDISGSTGPGLALCVSYYMAMAPVPGTAWETLTASDVLASQELASFKEPKRFCTVAGDQSQVFLIRTREGATGLLKLYGHVPGERCLNIHYKLVEPVESIPSASLQAAK